MNKRIIEGMIIIMISLSILFRFFLKNVSFVLMLLVFSTSLDA